MLPLICKEVSMLVERTCNRGIQIPCNPSTACQKVLKGKKLLLFQKLLAGSGCPDLGTSDVMTGLELVGTASKSPFFDAKLVPATTTPQFLQMSARWQGPKMGARKVHAGDPEMSRLLWDTTLQEVESGFLEGPF